MKELLKVFKALSDPTRLRMTLLLLERELCVCELMYILKMEQSRVSHQLRILKDADLVEDNRQGRWMIYRIPEAIRESLESLLSSLKLGRLKDPDLRELDRQNLALCLRERVREKRGMGHRKSRRL